MDNKAQISAEMLIILAAIVAVAILLVTNLSSTSKDAASHISDSTDSVIRKIENITK